MLVIKMHAGCLSTCMFDKSKHESSTKSFSIRHHPSSSKIKWFETQASHEKSIDQKKAEINLGHFLLVRSSIVLDLSFSD